ncbi:hypothetical protein FZEAL_9056 [Fusarium zealandicum]|uniref:Cytoplasmic protein n=1 Tax=Fusarium zealandicum TaxID=1053134 RepID=A0A8H4XH85_9HYPO|nr:hypothetical protein FZEAL_9056 [Fusarium zealandicum]
MAPSIPQSQRLIDTVSEAHRMSYHIGRGEQGVLTYEPYKSTLLPLWRFRTVPVARKSAQDLWEKFKEFDQEGDFVGMDMTRKFIQMGMTRAKRYANHAGGRKYNKGTKEELPRSESHPDKDEKEQASQIFRQYWERCKAHENYQELKGDFLKQQKQWKSSQTVDD